jgi:isopenicillin-N epimerase
MKFGKDIKHLWHLNPEVTFINHGSFGAAPKQVLDAQSKYRVLMETEPVEFYLKSVPDLLERSRKRLAGFIHCNPANLVFNDNATQSINTILFSLIPKLEIGSEILYNNQIYPAIRQTLIHYASIFDIKLKEVYIPYPTTNKEIIEIYKSQITINTKIAIIDQISSGTAINYPVKELSNLFKEYEIITIIDGAHSAGIVDLNIDEIGCDFYTSNCHKWLFAPKGAAFLWINDKFKDKIHPLTISLFYKQGLIKEFEWQGTKDVTPWLSVFDAIEFFESFGKMEIIEHNRNLNLKAKKYILDNLETYSCSDELNQALTTFYFTDKINSFSAIPNEIRTILFDKYKIEMPFFSFDNKLWFRISAQIYNEFEDYLRLPEILKRELGLK